MITLLRQFCTTDKDIVMQVQKNLEIPHRRDSLMGMFTIEHDFDSTVVTLVDEGKAPLTEDVIVNAFEECVPIEQYDPRTETTVRITLSMSQVNDLGAALDLPEGVYRLKRSETKRQTA